MRVRILAAVLALLAGSSVLSIILVRHALLQRVDEEVASNLRREVLEFELLMDGLNPRTGAPFGNDVEAAFELYFAREVPDEGETMLAFVGDELYRTERAPSAIPPEQLGDAIAYWSSLEEQEVGTLDATGASIRYAALPIPGGEPDGLLVVANFPAFERTEITDAVRAQALMQLGAVLLASLLGLRLAGRVLRPLRLLADTAQTISETDLTRRIAVHRDDEASLVARAFNDMLERLEHALATQRQFLNDAGHELRVPLTVIRGHLEQVERRRT